MKEFKNIPSNKSFVEGSIAESYIVGESVRYCMEYMPNPLEGNHKHTREAFLDDTTMKLEPKQFQQIRRWVLFRLNIDGLDEYYRFVFL